MDDNHRLTELKDFIKHQIVPQYDNFDAAHGRGHVEVVMKRAIELSQYYPEADPAIVLAAAAYHDLGLSHGREQHHLYGAQIVRKDVRLKQWFSDDEIELIADAVEDHRASNAHEPRTLYGKLVAEADRLIDVETIVRRTIQYGLNHNPELSPEEQYQRVRTHLFGKYGPDGYLKLWIPHGDNAQQLAALHAVLRDEQALRTLYDKEFAKLAAT